MKHDMNPANPKNWKMVCSACGTEWFSDEVVDLVDGHFQKEHPDLDNPHFNLVWVGIGPKPKGGYKTPSKRRRR